MKLEKILTIEKFDNNEKGIDRTRNLTANERVSLVEDLRREMAKVTHNKYPIRLRRVLEIIKK